LFHLRDVRPVDGNHDVAEHQSRGISRPTGLN
jgi:hypothetical protein